MLVVEHPHGTPAAIGTPISALGYKTNETLLKHVIAAIDRRSLQNGPLRL